MGDLAREKKALRERARVRRRDLYEKDQAAGACAALALRDAFLAREKITPGAIVAGYVAHEDEIDPRPLLEALAARGCRLALPVVTEKGGVLTFRAWGPGEPLTAGLWGIPEPPATALVLEPDFLIVPLLAFDRQGGRLGYGGGYYDRTLAALRARKPIRAVGVAYVGQEVPEVPCGPSDARLDAIVSVSVPCFKSCG